MKVLYVEDNPANVFLVKRVAKMGQHEIINYIDGGQALKKFDDINPDLVLMDIQLAGDIGGLDVVRELRGRGVKVPIIAVTAYAMVGDKERCIEAGCDDYLAKPLPVPRLVEIFQEYSDKVIAAADAASEAKDEPPAMITAASVEARTKDAESEKKEDTEASESQSTETTTVSTEEKIETVTTEKVEAPKETKDTLEMTNVVKDKEDSTTLEAEVSSEPEKSEDKPVGRLSEEDTLPVQVEKDVDKSTEKTE